VLVAGERRLKTSPMPLDACMNTFAGNPLDRASDQRSDADWLAGQLGSSESLGIALWNGAPLVERPKEGGGGQIAYLPAKLVPRPRRLPGARRGDRGGLRPRAGRGGRPEDGARPLSLHPAVALPVLVDDRPDRRGGGRPGPARPDRNFRGPLVHQGRGSGAPE